MNAPVLCFQKLVKFTHKLVEDVRVFFHLDALAQPIHAFAFGRSHGRCLLATGFDNRKFYQGLEASEVRERTQSF
jgi:hypothetical protein